MRSRRNPRAAILLECVLALALFVGAGLAILTLADRASESMLAARTVQTAADIAASAMAQIEAGILSPEAIQGDSHKWMDADSRWTDSPSWQGWRIELDSEPATEDALTVIGITVFKDPDGRTSDVPIYRLRQIVSLLPPRSDGIGSDDPLAARLGQAGAK